MATESPVRMMPGGGMRGGIGGLSESLRAAGAGAHTLSSSPTTDGVAHELGLLLRGRGRYDNLVMGRDVPQRSGSAPPSVEGSLAAMGDLLPRRLSKQDLADGMDEQEVRSDPAYLAYYYSHINLNPRLPPPLISPWENWRLAQRLSSGQAVGGIGDKRKGRSLDDSSSKSLFSTQHVLPTHREEPEHLEDENSPLGNLLRQTSSEWAERGDLMGLSGIGLEGPPKRVVDRIQEDFPRTPSPVYNHSRSSSRAANEDGVDDIQLTHLRDAAMGSVSVADLSAVVASLSRSSTPNPGGVQIHGSSSSGITSTIPSAPLPRMPTPSPDITNAVSRSASPGAAMMAAVSGLASSLSTELRSVSLGTASSASAAELAAALQGFNLSDVHGATAAEERENLHQHQQLQQEQRDQQQSQLRAQQQQHQQQQQQRQQRAQIAQAQAQAQAQVQQAQAQAQAAQAAHSQALAYSQALQQQQQQQQQVYPGLDQGYRGQVKYGVQNMSPQAQAAGMQAGASAPNMYAAAAAAAAMSYMAAGGNPYYQNMHSALYAPQYGLGGYPMNPGMITPMMAGYPPPGTLPVTFDGAAAAAAAAVAASMGVRTAMPGSPGGAAAGVDMQQLYKFAGQPGVQDPFYLQYIRAAEDSARAAAALNDPSVMRGYMAGGHVDVLELQKNQLLGYTTDQKGQYQRSGAIGVPITSKSGSVSPAYYGSPPGVGLVMPYGNSPLASPVLPGSPVAPVNARRDERGLRLAPSRSASAVPNYSGWQSQRGSDAGDEIRGSSLLEEFKNSKTRRFELSDIAGHVGEFSADQHGSRFIQQKLETASPEEKAMVFQEVLPRALTLMTDVFGNYVIQKFFEHGTTQQRRDLAKQLVGHVLSLSLQMYGCRVIQKALEVVDVDQQSQLVSELDGHIMRCVRDQNGNHVIQKCIECVPPDRIHFIISSFYGQVVILSTHPYGCRVIQRVLEHCTDDQKQRGIMEEILRSTCSLAMDQYGNYVVQHVLEHGRGHERSDIITKLAGQIVQMSQHKFASNVIEKCLEFGGPAERQILINEMLGHTDENEPLQAMMKDQFANYVVQKVLETCDEQQREVLLSRIKVHLHALKKYTYGKHIVARVEKLVAAGERRSAAYMAHLPA